MLTPTKAIRAKCLDCSAGSANDVKAYPVADCPLFPYRLGKNPNLQKKRMPAQIEALRNGRVAFGSVDNPGTFGENYHTEGNYTPATKSAAESHPAPHKEKPLA